MTLKNAEETLKRLFQKPLTTHNLRTVHVKAAIQALRSIMSTAELHRLFFILESLPETTPLRAFQEELLRSYQSEILERLIEDHLFIAQGGELKIIRRPEILEVYYYQDHPYLAISERQLITGKPSPKDDKAEFELRELCSFDYLPKPSRNRRAAAVQEAWGMTYETINNFLRGYFKYTNVQEEKTFVHREQVDVFKDGLFVLLRYDRKGNFLGALPPPDPFPQVAVVVGERKPEGGPGRAENPEDSSIMSILEEPSDDPLPARMVA